MDVSPKISSPTLYLFMLCWMAMLLKPQVGCGQLITTPFKPFKVELQESFSPVKKKLLRDEISEIIAAQQRIAKDDLWSIRYWNGSYHSYRWHQLLMQASRNHKCHKNGGRVAIMHLAIYDAMVEVWRHKKVHFQKAAYQHDSRIQQHGQKADFSAFLCEWSAAAGAAHRVIGYYFPE